MNKKLDEIYLFKYDIAAECKKWERQERMGNKKYKRWGIYVVFGVMGILFLLQSLSYKEPSLKVSRPSSGFSDGWRVDVNGKKERTTVHLPYTAKENKPEQILAIERELPDKNLSGYYLRVGSSQQEFRVYLNGKQIYFFPSMRQVNHGKTGGATWVLVKLPENSGGKTVRLEFCSSYQRTAGSVSRVWLGKKEQLITDIYMDSVGGIGISISLFVLAVFLAVMQIRINKRQREKPRLYLSILIVFIALWLFCQSQYQVFLFHNYAICYFLEFSLLYLFPVLLNLCLEREFHLEKERILIWMRRGHLVLAGIFFLGQILGWFTLFQVQDLFLCIFSATFLVDLLIMIKDRKKEQRLYTCLVILGILFVAFLLDFVLYDVYLPIAPLSFVQIGVILSELYVVYIVIRQWIRSVEVSYQNTYLRMQLENQLSHYSELEKRNQDLKYFRHDIRNHLGTIQHLMEKNQLSLASEYIHNMEDGLLRKDRQMIETGNPILDAVLSEKISIAMEHKIQIQHEIVIFKNIRLESLDGCAIFGNILDNAIEACMKIEEEEKRIIKIKIVSKANMLICKFRNTVNENIPIDKELRTTKPDAQMHGMGIKNIRNSVEKYGGQVKFERKEDYFEVSFVLFDV